MVRFELIYKGLVSYYLARVLETVGIVSKTTQNQVNLGLNCWNLVTGFTASYLVSITPRRVMYLTSVTGMFITFAAWTGASASFANTQDSGAAAAVVAMIFLYCRSFTKNTSSPISNLVYFRSILQWRSTNVSPSSLQLILKDNYR